MIPKIIHYCWFGQSEMPPLAVECIKTWKSHLHDYDFIKWDESNCPRNDFMAYHLDKGNWAFAADYTRLHALHDHGGIYLDTDIEVIKSFDDLLENNGFVGFEAKERATNGVAGSVKGNEFFNDCIKYMINRFELGQEYHISPIVTTSVLDMKSYDITVFEKEYFYPYNPYDESEDIKILMYKMITKHTHAIHHWAYSWKPKSETVIEAKKGTGLCNMLNNLCSKLSKISRRYF